MTHDEARPSESKPESKPDSGGACPSGLLIIDKPVGWTSMDVCARVRALVRRGGGPKRSKVGHAGTLDPFATGVLVVLVGKATKLSDAMMAGEKEYTAEVDLSRSSDTQDPTGVITEVVVPSPPDEQAVRAALVQFVGVIQQRPPIHSAMSIGGQRAYHLARKGQIAELPPRPVTVHEMRLDAYAWPIAKVFVRCGKGTYIRSLARDLGAALGAGGMLTQLRRERVGRYGIGMSRTIDSLPSQIVQSDLLPLLDLGVVQSAQDDEPDNPGSEPDSSVIDS